MSELKLLENAKIHISEWIKRGYQEGEWFYIYRNEPLKDITIDTPIFLANLILQTLERYGEFETRQTYMMFEYPGEVYRFEHMGHEFVALRTTEGGISEEPIGVMSVSINAKIVRRKDNQ
ncbi:MAG: hypothetical protein ACYTEQ_11670 [Planctomycetota bacterium]|jgi:hypothetical protein